MSTPESLRLLSLLQLDTSEITSQLYSMADTSTIYIAIKIAAESGFLSSVVLSDFLNHADDAVIIARILKRLHQENLIPKACVVQSPVIGSTALISSLTDHDLQCQVYSTVLADVKKLYAFDMVLKYVAKVDLKHNIVSVLNSITYSGFVNLALHNLSGANRLDQAALDRVLADPERALEVAKEIYMAPASHLSLGKPTLDAIVEEKPARVFPKPPTVRTPYRQ